MEYTATTDMVTVICCYSGCGITFGMTKTFNRLRRNDHRWWCCPNGHQQQYSGKNEEEKLRGELKRKQAELQREQLRALEAEGLAKQKDQLYKRLRHRVIHGVCPCCTRTFENVARHMADMHPEFGRENTLKHIRVSLGLTQREVAIEAHVKPSNVSLYENNKLSPDGWVAKRLEKWVEEQSA